VVPDNGLVALVSCGVIERDRNSTGDGRNTNSTLDDPCPILPFFQGDDDIFLPLRPHLAEAHGTTA